MKIIRLLFLFVRFVTSWFGRKKKNKMSLEFVESLIIKYLEAHPEEIEKLASVIIGALIKHLVTSTPESPK